MIHTVQRWYADEKGATAIEYGLMAALIAVVIVNAVSLLGPKVKTGFTSIGTTLH